MCFMALGIYRYTGISCWKLDSNSAKLNQRDFAVFVMYYKCGNVLM